MMQRQMNHRPRRPMNREISAPPANPAMLRQAAEPTAAEAIEAVAVTQEPQQSAYRAYQAAADQLTPAGENVQWAIPDRGLRTELTAGGGSTLVLLNMTLVAEKDGQYVLSLYAGEQMLYSANYQMQAYQPVTILLNSRAQTDAADAFTLRNDGPEAIIIQQATLNLLEM